MKFLSLIFTFIMAALVISFTASNQDSVMLSLFPFNFRLEIPLVLLLYVTLLAGVLLGFIVSILSSLLTRSKRNHD